LPSEFDARRSVEGRRHHAGLVFRPGFRAPAKGCAARDVIEATYGTASVRRIGDASSRSNGLTFSRWAARLLDGVLETGQRTLSLAISIQ
jgi:hypothetical protein